LLFVGSMCASASTFLASWYGGHHRGHKTASGETFNPDDLTAASWKYPFGTLLRVTNTRNHKDVIVRVNDRGPGIHTGRCLDISERAAELLDIKQRGIARVLIEVVK
jgi:rare lipoprotein A